VFGKCLFDEYGGLGEGRGVCRRDVRVIDDEQHQEIKVYFDRYFRERPAKDCFYN